MATGGVERVRSVFRFLNTNARLAGTMSAEATRLLGREVKVSDVEITGDLWSLSSANFVRLKQVSLAADPGYALPLVVVDEVALAYNLDRILRPKYPALPLIDSLHLESPHARVQRDAKGHTNFDKLISKLREAGPGGGRPLLDRATIAHGRVDYADAALSLRKGIAPSSLETYVEDANATINIRQSKSIAFALNGRSDPKLVDRFEVKGVYFTDQPRLAVSLNTAGAQIKTLAERLLLPKEAILNSGVADANLSAVYAPSPGQSIAKFSPSALRLSGSVKINGLTGRTGRSSEPIDVPVAELAVTENGANANINALVGGSRVQVLAQNIDFSVSDLFSGNQGAQLPNSFHASGEITVPNISKLEESLSSLTAGVVPPRVSKELKQLAGAVDVKFRGDGDIRNPRFTLAATARKLSMRYGEIAQSNLYARVENHQLRATFTANALGGSIHAKASASLSGKPVWRAQATGRGLKLTALPSSLRRLIVKRNGLRDLTGDVEFNASAAGEGAKPPAAEVAATAVDAGLAGQKWRLVSVNADTNGKDVNIRRLRLEDKRGYLVAVGRIGLKDRDLDLQVAANELNVPELLDVADQVAPRFAPKFKLPLDPSEADAILYLRGDRSPAATITGKWNNPRVSGRLTAFNLLAGRLELDKAVATFDLNRDRLIVTSGSVARAPGNVTFSGIVDSPLSSDPDISVTASVDSLDLNYLLYEAGLRQPDVRVTGTISSENPILITGTVGNPQLREPATLVLERSSINGVPIKDGLARADYRDGKLTLIEARIQGLNGSIAASGTATKEGALDLSLAMNGIDLSEADAFLPDTASLVRGKLSASVKVQGTIKSPDISATLNGDGLGFGAYSFGDLTGSASLADRVASVKDLKIVEAGDPAKSIPSRTLALASATYNLDTRAITGAGSWDGVTEGRIRGLLQGVLDANATDIAFRNNLAQLIGNLPPFLPGPTALPAFMLLAQQSKDPFAMVEAAAALMENVKTNLSGSFAIKGTAAEPVVTLVLAESPLQAGGLDLTLKKSTATITKDYFDAPEIEITASDGDLIARNTHVDFKGDIRSDIDGYNLNLAPFSRFMKSRAADAVEDYSITGTANIGVQVRGKTAAPEIEQASVNMVDVAAYRLPVGVTIVPGTPPSTELIYKINRVDINDLTLKNGVLGSDDLRITVKSTVARGKFSAGGIEYRPPFLPENAPLHAEISLLPKSPEDKNLQELASLASSFLDPRSTGTVAFKVSVDGTKADPARLGERNAGSRGPPASDRQSARTPNPIAFDRLGESGCAFRILRRPDAGGPLLGSVEIVRGQAICEPEDAQHCACRLFADQRAGASAAPGSAGYSLDGEQALCGGAQDSHCRSRKPQCLHGRKRAS